MLFRRSAENLRVMRFSRVPLTYSHGRGPIVWVIAGIAALCIGLPAAAERRAPARTPSSAYDCVIEPEQVVKLASPVVGVIARLDVDRGDLVHKGQVVGKLEDGVETAALALARAKATNQFAIKSAEARLNFLRRKYGRLDELHNRSVSSLADLQQAEAETEVAEQQLKEARLTLEMAQLEVRHVEEILKQRTLLSPIDGVVVERLLLPGEYRNEQSPILTLAKIDELRVEVFVPTARFGEIGVGRQAEVWPEAPIGASFVASVTVVDRVVDAASGTFGVRLALPNPDLRLPAGIRCKVQFESAASDATAALAR
jgi:RND family efflux transporter MFP subunit